MGKRRTNQRSECLVVLVTCPTKRSAVRLADALVRQRLAACVNILPQLESFFRWQGNVDRARELLLVAKTTTRRFEAFRKAVLAAHPYDVPEIVALPITRAHQPYVAWLASAV